MRHVHFCVAVVAISGCATAKGATKQANEGGDFGLPPVHGALEFPAGAEEVPLSWLVDELARMTGQELTMSPQLRQQLQVSKEHLEITAPVPADEVYAFVESILAAQGVLIAPVKGGERPVLGLIHPAQQRGAGAGEMLPVVIDPGKVEALADHPALLCQVMLVFENIDSRQLQTQLRQLLADSSGMKQCVPAGDRGLLIQAPGAQLVGLARLLREVDLASAARPRTAPQPAAGPALPTAPRPGG